MPGAERSRSVKGVFRSLKPYQLGVDIGAAAVFALVFGAMELRGPGVFAVTVVVLLAVALGLRRLSPGLSLAVAWLAAFVQMGAGLQPFPSDIAILAVLYATAAYGSRLVFWLGFASTFLGAAAISIYLAVTQALAGGGWDQLSLIVTIYVAAAFGLALAWVTGALVRTAVRARETRRAKEQAELSAATEHERGRIARDMHDVVAHSLAVVIAQADGARYAAASEPAVATQALETIGATARSALADVRLLLTQLRHSEGAGPQPTLADLEGLYADVRAAGLDLAVDIDPAPASEPGAGVQLAVFRILQEALTNALRHGDGTRVDVALAWHPDRVELEVRNAIGSAPRADGGHGVVGMRERAQLAGGTLAAGPDGEQYVVRARLPIGATA